MWEIQIELNSRQKWREIQKNFKSHLNSEQKNGGKFKNKMVPKMKNGGKFKNKIENDGKFIKKKWRLKFIGKNGGKKWRLKFRGKNGGEKNGV